MIQNRILMWGILSTSVAALFTLATLSSALTISQQAEWVATEVALTPQAFPAASEVRATPKWWRDAKFGIFICWNRPRSSGQREGDRSSNNGSRTVTAQERELIARPSCSSDCGFGPNTDCVKASTSNAFASFDADQWAETLHEAGAKYVVMTSKLDDGFCMWPSEHADQAWGRPWCSTSCGPHRDLLGEMTQSVRKAGMKMGLQFAHDVGSNPAFGGDVDEFFGKHQAPQFKDVVARYMPSVVISESKSDLPAVKSKSAELLSWLVAVPQCKNDVAINNRSQGSDQAGCGGYSSFEYGHSIVDGESPWEVSRDIEIKLPRRDIQLDDPEARDVLTLMLIDVVSRGGNFLLNVSPAADGRLSQSATYRLAEIGRWLEVNGEAIFGTTTHQENCQWTDGHQPDLNSSHLAAAVQVNKVLRTPDVGFARKEVLFTRNADTLYAICPTYPDRRLKLKGITASPTATVTMLGHVEPLKWHQNADGIVIETPENAEPDRASQAAWTFKISQISL